MFNKKLYLLSGVFTLFFSLLQMFLSVIPILSDVDFNSYLPFYIIILVITNVSFIILIFAFFRLSKYLDNNILYASSLIAIILSLLTFALDFYDALYPINNYAYRLTFIILMGLSSLFFGVSLYSLSSVFGNVAKISSLLVISFSIIFLSIVFTVPSLIIGYVSIIFLTILVSRFPDIQ